MTELMFFIELSFVCIFSTVSYVLIQQYMLTKVVDFLIFGIAFFAYVSLYSIDIAFDLIYSQPYDGTITVSLYVTLQKIFLLLNIIFWSAIFYIGYNTQWEKGHKIHVISFVFSTLVLILLTLNLEFGEIPEQSIFYGISIDSEVAMGSGAILEVLPGLYYGQGHQLLFILYRLYCVSILIYAFFNLKNPLQHPKFNRARLSWIIIFTLYFLTQILVLLSTLSVISISLILHGVMIIFSILGLLYLAIFVPEGLLLPKTQIINLAKIYESMEFQEKQKSPNYLMNKTIEYIEFVGRSLNDYKDSSIDR